MFKGDRNFTVGLFVTVAIAAFVFFVIWLTGRSGAEEMTRYSVLFERDVGGLAVGGPVKYMGMNVGSVAHMSLDKSDGIRVRVDIEILESTPVDSGTWASLALQGITGVAVVNLATEPGDHEPLKRQPGHKYPDIPVRVVGFSAVLSSAPEIMSKLDHLLGQASELLDENTRDSVQGTLENVEALTGSLAENREAFAALPGELENTITQIRATVGRLDNTLGALQPDMAATVEHLRESSENLASLTGRLDRLLTDHEESLGRFIDEGLDEVPPLMEDARRTLREMEKLLRQLGKDPSQFIHRGEQNPVEIDP
jgi:phospholipid/cholesterol/gamma-HCH transport system substrate-binding protein